MRTILWAVVAATILVGGWMFIKGGNTKLPSLKPSGTAPPISVDEQSRGNPNAQVTIIEYGDFQCPSCASYHPLTEQLIDEYGEHVLFVYRHFPLTKIHDSADLAARAAEAAGLQGRYWDMHDWLYENQLKWAAVPLTASTVIKAHAKAAGLNMEQFEKDLESPAVAEKVRKDQEGGVAAGVAHTPTFFLNLKEIPNPRTYDTLKDLVDEALMNAPR